MEIMNWQEITMESENILEDQRIIQSVASKIVPENGTESF